MKKMTVQLFKTAVALALCAAAVTAAHANTLADIKKRGEIAIAVDLGTPPFGSVNAQLQPFGADVDVATKLAKDMGVKLRIVEVTGPNRIPFLMTQKADIVISSFAITPEREKVVDFVPYSVNRLVVFAPAPVAINSMNTLVGKKIAVVRGNLQDTELTRRAPQGTILSRYDDDATTIAALLSGQVDALCAPYGMFLSLQQQYADKKLEIKLDVTVQPLGIGLRKNDPELKAWLTQWTDDNVKNGTLSTVFQKYMGVPLPDLKQFAKK
ncbi:transporter substrate-binding domain-containing protein [Herbaspirillum autotrophicum]|uniref:transporter substrate-binding domain-containing protein n=1 Tax=Herbaspirillum autotrophicum TaxID=180195 RepID=UPI00067C8F99|nr:transporter substrate-binding domain-containing protein [Herbaspirillum autotrophicum]